MKSIQPGMDKLASLIASKGEKMPAKAMKKTKKHLKFGKKK